MRTALVAACVAAGLLVAWWALLFVTQRSMLFPAPAAPAAATPPGDAQVVWLETAGGRVEAWLLPAFGTSDGAAPLLLFLHGNGELIDHWPAAFEVPRRAGLAVLLVEYPGYGRSEGRPSQRAVLAATLAAYDWATRRPDIDDARIVAYGRSLGGGAAALLAAERPVAALVLESTFTSVHAFARRMGAPAFLVRDRFDNVETLARVRAPTLLLHGERDDIVPPAHARALHAARPEAELVMMPCGHNDCALPWPAIERFLVRAGVLRAA